MADVTAHPHMLERGTIREVKDPKLGSVLMPGMPLRFSGFEHNAPLAAAHLGEHNEAVLEKVLGYSEDQIRALNDSGVLFNNPDT